MKPLKDDLAAQARGGRQAAQGASSASPSASCSSCRRARLARRRRPGRRQAAGRLILSADAGKNAAKMTRGPGPRPTKQAEEAGGKVTTETFKGATLHVIQPRAKETEKDDPAAGLDQPGERLPHRHRRRRPEGRARQRQGPRRLAGRQRGVRPGPEEARRATRQVVWFVDLAQVLKLAGPGRRRPGRATPQQFEAMLQLTGLNGLKAVGGSFAFNAGDFDRSPRPTSSPRARARASSRSSRCPRSTSGPSPGSRPPSPATRR